MLLLNVEKTLVLYSIVSDIPKNELMTIPEIARVTIELIKNIENNFLLIVKIISSFHLIISFLCVQKIFAHLRYKH
tara:strand:- start:516 stop:743 length:228 start_codon:yes stop_codon:yes gene_type:complete